MYTLDHRPSLCNFLLMLFTVFQKADLRSVVEYLRADGNVTVIGLWGRSMGAVTRFFHALPSFYFVCTEIRTYKSSLLYHDGKIVH